jgi:hypothetical protein
MRPARLLAAILLVQALPYPKPRDQNCAPATAQVVATARSGQSHRDTCGGSVRGEVLIVEVLTARHPMVLILKSPFPNPASTAGTSFTPDMSNPSRRERDDED